MTHTRKNMIAAFAGLAALALLTSVGAAHGTGGNGDSGGANPPATQPAPGMGHGGMMNRGMMGHGMMNPGMMGHGMMAQPPRHCTEQGAATTGPCENQGQGDMPMPQGQMLPPQR